MRLSLQTGKDDVWISKRSRDHKWEEEFGRMMDDMEKEWQDTGSCCKCGHTNYVQPEDSYYCMKYGEFTIDNPILAPKYPYVTMIQAN